MPIQQINCKTRQKRDYLADLSDDALLRHQGTLDNSGTVAGVLFRTLKAAKGEWVSVPTLGRAALTRAMGSHIGRLREKGCLIDNKIVWPDNHDNPNAVHVFYKLLAEPRDEIERRRACS